LTSLGIGSDAFAVATCTGDDLAGTVCDESGDAVSTIDFGWFEAGGSEAFSEVGVVSVAVLVTDSAAVATSALATTALRGAVARGEPANSASAVRDDARLSSIGTAPLFTISAEPMPASQATTEPARTSVPHAAAATIANRRGFMIRRLQGLHPNQAAQPSM
jgi:hypothetical protein